MFVTTSVTFLGTSKMFLNQILVDKHNFKHYLETITMERNNFMSVTQVKDRNC